MLPSQQESTKRYKLKNRIRNKQSKTILQSDSELLLKERIQINHAILDRLKNRIEQLKGKILESIIHDVFYLVENIHKNLHKKYFDLPNERDIYENLMD